MLSPRYTLALIGTAVVVALCVLQPPPPCRHMDVCRIEASPQSFVADASAQTAMVVAEDNEEPTAVKKVETPLHKKPRVVESEPIPLDSLPFDL